MAAITWRNVDAPDLRGASSMMGQATQTMNTAFDALGKTLQDREATEKANWSAMKDYNTTQAVNEILKFQDPKAYQEALASGAIQDKLNGYGAQVDATRVSQLMDGRLAALQKRELDNQAFTDAQQERGQRDVVNGLQEALLRASNPDEVSRIKQAIGIYQGANMLNGSGGVALTKEAVARDLGLVKEDRDAKEFASKEKTAEAQRQKWIQDSLNDAARVALAQSQNEVQRIQAAGQIMLNSTGKATDIAEATNKRTETIQKEYDKFKEKNPFEGGSYSKTKPEDYIAFAKKLNLKEEDATNFLNRIEKAYPSGMVKLPGFTEAVPLTKNMVEMAMMRQADTKVFTWDNVPFGTAGGGAQDELKTIIESPGFMDSYKDYLGKTASFTKQLAEARAVGDASVSNLQNKTNQVLNALGGRFSLNEPPKKAK